MLEDTINALAEVVDITPRDRRRFKRLMEESRSFESLPLRTRLTDAEVARFAARLVEGARGRKASGLDAFLQTYGLGTDEGIALMCLSEALLRVPDPAR